MASGLNSTGRHDIREDPWNDNFQDKEETYIRNSQEGVRGMYGGSGKCIMKIMSYEVNIWENEELE